jgi:hypothetical protein
MRNPGPREDLGDLVGAPESRPRHGLDEAADAVVDAADGRVGPDAGGGAARDLTTLLLTDFGEPVVDCLRRDEERLGGFLHG